MAENCQNCGQKVLASDTACWHCGQPLPHQEGTRLVEGQQQAQAAEKAPMVLSAVAVYSVVTAVVMVGLIWIMNVLAQRPLIIINPDTNIHLGWVPFTDQAQQFTLDFPPNWQFWEKENGLQASDFEALVASNTQFETAVAPLGEMVVDTTLLMIGMSEPGEEVTAAAGFVVVARSQRLSQLSNEEVLLLAQEEIDPAEVIEVGQWESIFGDLRAALRLHMRQTPDNLICQQHIVLGGQVRFLIAGCAPEGVYPRYQQAIDKILASFQPLQPLEG